MHVFVKTVFLATETYVSPTTEQDEDAMVIVLCKVFVFQGCNCWKLAKDHTKIIGKYKVTVVSVTKDIATKVGSVSKIAQDVPGQSLKSLLISSLQ